MKKALLVGVVLGPIVLFVGAYQPSEHGLFYAHSRLLPYTYEHKADILVFEKRPQGVDSRVLLVNGLAQFQDRVLQASFLRPVVVKIYTNTSIDAQKMRPIFQDVADTFDQVAFIALDVLLTNEGQGENAQIVASLMQLENVDRLELPIFLFFKDGKLFKSEQAPAALIQGFYSKENLENFIQTIFFQPTGGQDSPVFDLTTTSNFQPVTTLPAALPEKNNKTGWQRFKQWFKKK